MKNSILNFKTLIVGTCLLVTFPTTNAQIQKGDDIDGKNQSGWSVSMPDENTVAIGAPGNQSGNSGDTGQVRIYSWSGNAWVQKGDDIDGEAEDEWSGYTVSMPDANTIAIGAPAYSGIGIGFGHVRIYSWSGTAWVQKGDDIDGLDYGDGLGWSVSMPDANTIAIVANGFENDFVRIYSWSGNAWIQKGDYIKKWFEGGADYSISMPDANTIAIGVPSYKSLFKDDAGLVRIYSWSGNAWVQKGDDIDGEARDDEAGYSVSMPDANTIAIGAPYNDGDSINVGHVRIYSWSGNAWVQKGDDIDGEAIDEKSGWSVSMPDENTVAIGAILGSNTNGRVAGNVRIYGWSGTSWVQIGTNIMGETAYNYAGYSISMPDANTIAIGAPHNDGNGYDGGHVRVYSLSGLGIEEKIVTNIKVYPNPSSTQVIIDNGNYSTMGSYNAEIVNAMGQQVFHSVINHKQFIIDTKTMGGAGIYTLYITDENNKVVGAKKIVLQ